jgi:hypothetical protein
MLIKIGLISKIRRKSNRDDRNHNEHSVSNTYQQD